MTDRDIIKRISEVAEVRDIELGRSSDNWERTDVIPPYGKTYGVVINRIYDVTLRGNYHAIIRRRPYDGKFVIYVEAEYGGYYTYNSSYTTLSYLTAYWNIVWFKKQVLVEKTGFYDKRSIKI